MKLWKRITILAALLLATGIPLQAEETTEDPSVVKVEKAHLIIDAQEGALRVLEMLRIKNESKKTFIGDETLEEGRRLVLRFTLPPDARGTQVEQGFQECCLVEIGEGFGWTHPLPPGTTEVGYSYVIPYKRRQHLFQRFIPYPTEELNILVHSNEVEPKGISFTRSSPVRILDRKYQHLTAKGVPAGSLLQLEIQGLPWNIRPAVWLSIGLGVLLFSLMAYAIRREHA